MPKLPNKPFEYAGYTMRYNMIPVQEGTGNIHEIYIYDSIEEKRFNSETWMFEDAETSAKHFAKILDDIPEEDKIVCYMNSNGGEVKEGVAIYNQFKRHKANKTVYVDGFANSVASLICMAFDKIVMGLGTSMLIHEIWMCVAGNASQLRKAADDLDDLMESNRQVYLERSGGKISEQELKELMEQEKFLTPEECIKYGFADEISEKKNEEPVQQQNVTSNMNELCASATDLIKQLSEALYAIKTQENPVKEELIEEPLKESEPEEKETSNYLGNLTKLFK